MAKRCDLSPFFHGTRRSGNPTESEIHRASADFDPNLKETLHQKVPGALFSSVIQYTWHKLLSVMGGSQITMLCVIDEVSPFAGIQIVDHEPCPIGKALSDLCTENLILYNVDEVLNQNDMYDAVITSNGSIATLKDDKKLILSHHDDALEIFYPSHVFEQSTILGFLEVATHLLEQIVRSGGSTWDISYVPDCQASKMETWNQTNGIYPKEKRLNNLFEDTVDKMPLSHICVKHNECTLSYKELNDISNQFARFLAERKNIQPEQFLGLFVDKSIDTVMAIMGAWKSGAAVVAIDPAYPNKRVLFSIANTDLKVIVTQEKYRQRLIDLCGKSIEILAIEDITSVMQDLSNQNLELNLNSRQLAYISYTSGTTGQPKGILKKHSSLVNSITDISEKYRIKGSTFENIVLYSSYVFEPFFRQMLLALTNGHCLHIVDDPIKMDKDSFSSFLEVNKITYLNGTPSILQEYDYSNCPHLKHLVLVGEQLTRVRYETLRKKFLGTIICEYGFTESAFVTLMKQFEESDLRKDTSLGVPMQNVKCYVLDKDMKRIPIGAVGSLFVGGTGVSSGYHNNPSLTASRFLANPYQTELEKSLKENEKVYQTGDLVSWTKDGQLLFHGRSDFQIKLRGIRIEPGEIESILSEHPCVQRCAVVVNTSKNYADDEASRQLVAYYTYSEKTKLLSEKELLQYLREHLPRYMIPSRIVLINKIPININGKADLKALPKVPLPNVHENGANMSNAEIVLREVWGSVLDIPVDSVSIDADFFMLGGNSIRCVQMIGSIQRRLNMFVTVDDIFRFKTIRQLLKKCVDGAVAGKSEAQSTDVSFNSQTEANLDNHIESIVAANSLQQGMVYHHFKQSHFDDAYIMQSSYEYRCAVKVDLMKLAWQFAQEKFSSLRSRFIMNEVVYQIIDKQQPFHYRSLDYSLESNILKKMDELLESDRVQKYDLSKGELFRVYMIKVSDTETLLAFSCHHIIIDGWSLQVLFDFVNKTYLDLCEGKEVIFAKDTSFVEAQKYIETKQNIDQVFWQKELDLIRDSCDLGSWLNEGQSKSSLNKFDFVKIQEDCKVTITNSSLLQEWCIRSGFTVNSVLQFVWHQVLHVYGNGEQTVVGTTFSGRNLPIEDIDQCVGMLINTLPVVVDHEQLGEKTVKEAIADTQSKLGSINSRSYSSLGMLPTNQIKHQLFQNLFVFDNYPTLISGTVKDNLGFKKVYNFDKLDYPLTNIITYDENQQLTFQAIFSSELLDKSFVTEALMLVNYLVDQILHNPDQSVSDLDYVVPALKPRMSIFNQTEASYPLEKCLHHIFEEEAELNHSKEAVIYEDKTLLYAQLNSMSNQLAHQLMSVHDVKPGDYIGLFQEKSEYLIASILAIWKCGAAFVPMDAKFPKDRVIFILEDTNAKLVLTNVSLMSNLMDKTIDLALNIIAVDAQKYDIESAFENPSLTGVNSSNVAYVMYTSGTTGLPKGVIVEHRGVLNLKFAMEELFDLKKEAEVILSFSNYIFDHFIEQMIDGILTGQTLVLLNDDLRHDPERLHNYMKSNKVTYLSGTPTVISQYRLSDLPNLKRVDVVGEDLKEETFNKIRYDFPGLIINGYGPTEISITSHKKLYPPGSYRDNKSIGHQVNNSKCYIVNKRGQLLPIGAVGEMYIGGIGVARGYLNREDLTHKKFVQNPFKEANDAFNDRLYNTGDQARWLRNGEVEFLGRTDQQVKLRGIRIELGEIESVLALHPSIEQVAVHLQERVLEDGTSSKILVAFFTSHYAVSETELKDFATLKLPTWLVPTRILMLESFPLSPSGKLNYKMLPKLDVDNSRNVDTPQNEVEQQICEIWCELLSLNMSNVGIHDNFFHHGGDSLSLMRLISMIRDSLDFTLTVPEVIQYPTISKLAKIICHCPQNPSVKSLVPKAAVDQVIPPTFEQEKLLFIEEYENGSNAYNIHLTYSLPTTTNIESLKKAFRKILMTNTAMRCVFPQNGKGRYLHVLSMEDVPALVTRAVCNQELDDELINESKQSFCLSKDAPFSSVLFETPDKLVLSIVVHHVAFDAHSRELFEEQLIHNYDERVAMHEKEDKEDCPNNFCANYQYRDFALWQHSNPESVTTLEYWRNEMAIFEPCIIASDFPRPTEPQYDGSQLNFSIDLDMHRSLKQLARLHKVSMNCLLTAAYLLTLSCMTRQEKVSTYIPISTRQVPEFNNTIGFFVNMLPLCVSCSEMNISEFIIQVQRKIFGILKNCDISINKFVKELYDRNQLPVSSSTVFATRKLSEQNTSYSDNHLQLTDYGLKEKAFTPAKFEIFIEVVESKDQLSGSIIYRTGIFQRKTIQKLQACFYQALLGMSEEINSAGHCLSSILSKCSNYVQVETYDRKQMSLVDVFENTVARNAESVAATHGAEILTYCQLNQQSNQLARFLCSMYGIGPGDFVALCLEKNMDMLVCIMAVLKCGAAFVPLDTEHPMERTNTILEDTNAKIAICNKMHQCRVKNSVWVLPIDDAETRSLLLKESTAKLSTSVNENNIAYIIYTSGTSGKPKGVPIQHSAVLSFFYAISKEYFVKRNLKISSVLFLSNYAFDFSIEQLLLSIFRGKKLVLPPSAPIIFDQEFFSYVNSNHLDYVSGTPSLLSICNLSEIKHLQVLLLAGETLTFSHFMNFRKQYKGIMIQAYGTTETTVYNTCKIYAENDEYVNSVGAALANTEIHILDENMKEVKIGSVGELFISGDCVSEGYLNKNELNKKSFVMVQDEKKLMPLQRLYRTGDLVRFNLKGELEYLGRNDRQISLHGLRIECEEIEKVALEFSGVWQAAVILDNSDKLACFVVPDDNHSVSTDELQIHLQSKLPSHMIPSAIHAIEQLPLTSNGKLNIPKMKDILLSSATLKPNSFVFPRTEIEAQLCDIWVNVLGTNNISIDDDFFMSGGDSIMSMQLISEIRRQTILNLTVKDIFVHRTIRKLCDHKFSTHVNKIEALINLPSEIDLIPIQRWFFAKELTNIHSWNHCFSIKIGSPNEVHLKSCITQLTRRHGAFSLRFEKNEQGLWKQHYGSWTNESLPIFEIDASLLTREEVWLQLNERQKNFNIQKGPLYAIAIIKNYDANSYLIWFSMHHLIVDTVSWQILLRDLRSMYHDENATNYAQDPHAFGIWAQTLQRYHLSDHAAAYWTKVREDCLVQEKLGDIKLHAAPLQNRSFTLDKINSQLLLSKSNHMFKTTTYELLLSALAYGMKEITNKECNSVTLEGHGREDIMKDLDQTETVGWFTTLFPFCLMVKDNIEKTIKETCSRLRTIPQSGIGYGILNGYDSQVLPMIYFNYLGVISKLEATSDWKLVNDYGLSEFPLERAKNDRSLIDVNAAFHDGLLTYEIKACLGKTVLERFSNSLQKSLIDIAITTGKEKMESNDMESIPFDPMITLELPRLFVLPPGEGGAESYMNNIVPFLQKKFNLYLFNNIYLHEGGESSFERLAEYYVLQILSIQKNGPIHLLGWSFGGILSIEIAKHLTDLDILVGNMFLIDPYFDVSKAYKAIKCPPHIHIVDKINMDYHPSVKTLHHMQKESRFHITLFKASCLPQKEMTKMSKEFYQYFIDQPFNNLEIIFGHQINVQKIHDDHYTWVKNPVEVEKICSSVIRAMELNEDHS